MKNILSNKKYILLISIGLLLALTSIEWFRLSKTKTIDLLVNSKIEKETFQANVPISITTYELSLQTPCIIKVEASCNTTSNIPQQYIEGNITIDLFDIKKEVVQNQLIIPLNKLTNNPKNFSDKWIVKNDSPKLVWIRVIELPESNCSVNDLKAYIEIPASTTFIDIIIFIIGIISLIIIIRYFLHYTKPGAWCTNYYNDRSSLITKKEIFILCFFVFLVILAGTVFLYYKFYSYHMHAADGGFITQAVYSVTKGYLLQQTVLSDSGYLSRLSFGKGEFILFLMAPFLFINKSLLSLLTIQLAVTYSAIIPLYLLARRISLSIIVGCVVAFGFIINPHLHSILFHDFHPNIIAIGFIIWAFWALKSRKFLLSFIFFFFAILCRVDITVSVAVYGAVLFIIGKGKEQKFGLIIAIFSVLWFLFVFKVVTPWATDVAGSARLLTSQIGRYDYLIQGNSILERLNFAFHNLGPIINALPLNKFYELVKSVNSPSGYLGVFCPLIELAIIPNAILNVFSKNALQHLPTYHYISPIIPFILIASSVVYAKIFNIVSFIKSKLFRNLIFIILASLSVAWLVDKNLNDSFLMKYYCPLSNISITKHEKIIRKVLDSIPAEAGVSASDGLHPHLACRTNCLLGVGWSIKDVDYVVADLSLNSGKFPYTNYEELQKRLLIIMDLPSWGVQHYEDGVLLLSKNAENNLELEKETKKSIAERFNNSFNFSIVTSTMPNQIVAGTNITFSVTIRNDSTQSWPRRNVIRIYGAWAHEPLNINQRLNFLQGTSSPAVIHPGDTVTTTFNRTVPPKPGKYKFIIDLMYNRHSLVGSKINTAVRKALPVEINVNKSEVESNK